MKDFPSDFLWGASTASHQVEGGLRNQWTEWEHKNAERLATTAVQRLGWLPDFNQIRSQATDPSNYISGNGVEHYTRYKEDFGLIKELGLDAFRFSVEWSRLEPVNGEWDEAAWQHYQDYILALKELNIEPILNLWHWTEPVWFSDKGGFAKRGNLKYFKRFVTRVAEEFGREITYVLTLNEPNVYTAFSYLSGEWPPQHKNLLEALAVYHNLVLAHREAYRILKHANSDLQIGLACNVSDTRPLRQRNPVNLLVTRAARYGWNEWFLNRVKSELDFIGINYYFTEYRDWSGRVRNPTRPVSDLGWYMEPSGIGNVITELWQKYRRPLLITENGLADGADAKRQWWLEQTIGAMQRSMQGGVKLIGYLHWSLLDNFEWAYGWWPKFGLASVNRKTMKRTIRPSARWLAKQIKNRD